MDPGSMNCFAIKHQKIHTKCVVIYFWIVKINFNGLKINFCFSNIDFNWNDTCSPRDRNVKKKEKNRKMTVLINVKSTFKLEWTWISYKQGQVNFGRRWEKNIYRFFLIATLRQCLFTAEVPQLWSDVSSRPEKPKKKWDGPNLVVGLLGEHTGLLCRPMVYGIRPASQYRPSQNTHHPAALPGQAIVRSIAATAMAKLSSLCRASSSLFTQQAWNKMKIHSFTATVKRFRVSKWTGWSAANDANSYCFFTLWAWNQI